MGFFFLLRSFYELNLISSLNTQQSVADRPFQRLPAMHYSPPPLAIKNTLYLVTEGVLELKAGDDLLSHG